MQLQLYRNTWVEPIAACDALEHQVHLKCLSKRQMRRLHIVVDQQ